MIEICRRKRRRLKAILAAEIGGGVVAAIGLPLWLLASAVAQAEPLVVVEARGIASTAGTQIDSKTHLMLRQGEHVRLIGANGNQYCLDGPYEGPAMPARTSSLGRSSWNLWNTGARDEADPLTDCIR